MIDIDQGREQQRLIEDLSADDSLVVHAGDVGLIDSSMLVGGSPPGGGGTGIPVVVPSVPALFSQVHSPPGYATGIDKLGQDLSNAYIDLAWPSNPGSADPNPENVVAYEVRHRATGTQTWKYERIGGTLLGGVALSHRLKGLAQNTNYDVNLQAVNSIGVASGFAGSDTIITTSNATAPGTPTGLSAYKVPRGVLAYWTPNPEADLQGYEAQILVDDYGELNAALTSGTPVTTLTVRAPTATSTGATGLLAAIPAGTVIRLNDGAGHTQDITTSASAAKAATSIGIPSTTPNFSYPIGTRVLVFLPAFNGVQLVTGTSWLLPNSDFPIGTSITVSVRAVNWSNQRSGYLSAAAVASDGVIFDEVLTGNLRATGTITTGVLRTASSGQRFAIDSTAISGYDATATDYGAGAGRTVKIGADGTAFFKGTIMAGSLLTGAIQSSTALGVPSIPGGFTGFQLDATNGLRFFNGGTLIAQFALNGTLTIYSGASITASIIQSSSGVGSGSGGSGVQLNTSFPFLRLYGADVSTGAVARIYGWDGSVWQALLDFAAVGFASASVGAGLIAARSTGMKLASTANQSGTLPAVAVVDIIGYYDPSSNIAGMGWHTFGGRTAIERGGAATSYFARRLQGDSVLVGGYADDFHADGLKVSRLVGVAIPNPAAGGAGANNMSNYGAWPHRYINAPTAMAYTKENGGGGAWATFTISVFGFVPTYGGANAGDYNYQRWEASGGS